MARITCTFAIRSAVLEATRITEITGCWPDHSVVMGSKRTPPRYVPEAHGWYLHVTKENSNDVEALLRELLDRARPILPTLGRLRAEDRSVKTSLAIAIAPAVCNDVPLHFSRQVLHSLADFDASLDVEFFMDTDTAPGIQAES